MKYRCPKEGCDGEIELPNAPTLDQISNTIKESLTGQLTAAEAERVIKEQLISQAAGKEDHRHKTADEFLDCPECRSWFDTTATKYQLAAKEPAASDKEPEPTAPAIGSIFKERG
ncbi:hypothetical protein ES703_13911 [subsurface metagenome]